MPAPASRTETILAGHPIRRVGYGAMQLADPGPGGNDAAIAVLRAAVELGANHIDTAEFYGSGTVNRAIRAALHPYSAGLVIATKIGARHDREKGLVAAQRPEELRIDVEANLASLEVERLDLVYLRRLDVSPGILATGEQLVDLDDQLAELSTLRDEGKIAAIGLSNASAGQVTAALPAEVASVQNGFNLLDRSATPVLDLCRQHGIAWVPFCPLGSGFPGWPKVAENPTVVAEAAALGVSPAQLGLAWLLAQYEHTVLIPGTRTIGHLRENLAALDLAVPADVRERLDALA